MRLLYLVSVWLHILAATAWIGGMFFLVLVVVPYLSSVGRANAGALLGGTGRRFRGVGWVCFGLLLLTGSFNLFVRGVRLGDLGSARFYGSEFGRLLLLKLVAFAIVLGLSAVHDFAVGPRATTALERDPGGAEAEALRRRASWLGRLNAVLALVLVALGVMLVRGRPW